MPRRQSRSRCATSSRSLSRSRRVEELRRLASRAGGVDELVAPKRRAEAEGLHGEKLLRWLAADGARVRRPIVVTGAKVTLELESFAGKLAAPPSAKIT